MWSPVERTSLAEAEVEYQEKTSPTIWVKFPVLGFAKGAAQPIFSGKVEEAVQGASVVIWTTTPWTIPGNRAISYSEKIEYGLARARELCGDEESAIVVTAGISRESGSTNLVRVARPND